MIKKAKLNHKDLFHAPIFRAAYHKIFWAQKTPTTTTAPIFLNYFAQLEQKTSNIIQVFFICISKMLLWKKHSYSFELFVSFLYILAFDCCTCLTYIYFFFTPRHLFVPFLCILSLVIVRVETYFCFLYIESSSLRWLVGRVGLRELVWRL